MTKRMTGDERLLTQAKLGDELMRLKRGSINRRHFLAVTGLGLAAATLAPLSSLRRNEALAEDLGSRVLLATWPNYHDLATFEAFTRATGVTVELNTFGSNEDMLYRLEHDNTGWDLLVPTNYAISTYQQRDLIEPLDLDRLPSFKPQDHVRRFAEKGRISEATYAVPKNWGTTGFAYNTSTLKTDLRTWKDFFEVARGAASGRTILHDYQLTTIGNALVALGYSFNSVRPGELDQAEALLMDVKPHLLAINSDYQPAIRSTDAWLTMCWTNDAMQMRRDLTHIQYVIAADGGEIFCDFYAISAKGPNKPGAYALLDFLLRPENAVQEHLHTGTPTTNAEVFRKLPPEATENLVIYPDEAALSPLEFGAAVTLTNPRRAEIMARLKSI